MYKFPVPVIKSFFMSSALISIRSSLTLDKRDMNLAFKTFYFLVECELQVRDR